MKSAEAFAELMAAYNAKRSEWISKTGSEVGFDEWFTKQVMA